MPHDPGAAPQQTRAIALPSAHRPVSLRPYYALLIGAIVAPILLFVAVAWQSHDSMLNDSMIEVQRTVELASQQAHSLLRTHQLLAQRIDEHLRGMTWEQIESDRGYLLQLLAQYPEATGIYLADVSCTLRVSTRASPQPPVSCADRDYYKALQAGSTGAIGGLSVGRTGGELNFNFAIYRRDGDGQPSGVIIISAFQKTFVNFWHALVPGPSVFGLYSDDGRILARLPPATQRVLTDPNSGFMRAVRQADHGSLEETSTVDGIVRLLAFKHIPEFQIFVAHGIPRASVIEAWRSKIMPIGGFFMVATGALIALAWLALRRAEQARSVFVEWERTARDLHAEEDKTMGLNRQLRQYADTLEARVQERTEELSQIERQLAQSQKMEAIGKLTGGIAHDFNNLLHVIIGNLDMLCERSRGTEDDETLQDVLDVALRGRDMVKRLLVFSRRQVLTPQLLDVNALVTTLFRLLEPTLTNVTVRLSLAEGLWPVKADSNQLADAITNLVTNARDAMPNGGQIAVATSNQHIADGLDMRSGDYIVIELSDTGSGMPQEVMEHIFEPFFTTKAKGTGLGLSMAFGFMKQSGGLITVSSALDQGTTFDLYLPRFESSSAIQQDNGLPTVSQR